MILALVIGLLVGAVVGFSLAEHKLDGYCKKLEGRHLEDELRLDRARAELAQRGEVV